MNDDDEQKYSRSWLVLYAFKLLAGIIAAGFALTEIGDYVFNITHP